MIASFDDTLPLFDLPESPSPRLRWMERYRVSAELVDGDRWKVRGFFDHATPCEGVYAKRYADESVRLILIAKPGADQEQALAALAAAAGVPLWNEEAWKGGLES